MKITRGRARGRRSPGRPARIAARDASTCASARLAAAARRARSRARRRRSRDGRRAATSRGKAGQQAARSIRTPAPHGEARAAARAWATRRSSTPRRCAPPRAAVAPRARRARARASRSLVPPLGARRGRASAARRSPRARCSAGYRFDALSREGATSRRASRRSTLLVDARPTCARRATPRARGVDHRRVAERRARALEPAAERAAARRARGARRARSHARSACAARVLDVPELSGRKMGAILAVGGGSANPPRADRARARADGRRAGKRRAPVCLVGKGITFDSGGISIKPAQRHGRDEARHVGRGRRDRRAARVRAARAADARGRRASAPPRTCRAAPRTAPATSSPRCRGKTIEIAEHRRRRTARARRRAPSTRRPSTSPPRSSTSRRSTGACVGRARHAGRRGLFGNHAGLFERVRARGRDDRRARLADAAAATSTSARTCAARSPTSRTAAAATPARHRGSVPLGTSSATTPWAHLDIAGTAWTERAVNAIPAARRDRRRRATPGRVPAELATTLAPPRSALAPAARRGVAGARSLVIRSRDPSHSSAKEIASPMGLAMSSRTVRLGAGAARRLALRSPAPRRPATPRRARRTFEMICATATATGGKGDGPAARR